MSSPPDSNGATEAAAAVGLPKPETTEAEWYARVYRGDDVPQLTWRAVLTGGVLGVLMAIANLYTTLKVGWAFGVAVTACVLSFVSWNLLRFATGGRFSQLSILENNCMASTASAAGYSTGASIAIAFGALLLLEGAHRPWWVVGGFTLLTGLMGVLLAVPMKRQMINQERLAFPTGTAAATTLVSLYGRSKESVRQAYALVGALGAGVVVGVYNTEQGTLRLLDRLFELTRFQLPAQIPAAGYWTVNGKSLLGLGFEPSVLLIGAGMITGVRVSLSMLAGSLLLYAWVGPQLVALDAAHGGEPGWVVSIPLVGGGTLFHLTRWALWGGTSVLVFGSLTAFALQWRTIARSFAVFRRKGEPIAADQLEATAARIEVPLRWLVIGMIPVTIALTALNYVAFHISVWLGLVAVAMSFVLSLVASRSTGETDTTPIGAMGKVMQLLFAVLSPPAASNVAVSLQHNLMAAGTAANAGSACADLLTDLKSGYLLGANPRRQFWAQFIGVFFGTLTIVPAWYLMVPDKARLEAFNPPATNMWKAVAEVLAGGGLDVLPHSAKVAIVIGGGVGVLLPLLERFVPRLRGRLPSCMGLGLSWVVPFANAQAFAIGALAVWAWTKFKPRNAELFAIPVASGLIAGESIIKALIAMASSARDLLLK